VLKSKFAGYTAEDMVKWSENGIKARGSERGPPEMTLNHLLLEAFV